MTKKTRNWLIIGAVLVVIVGGGYAVSQRKPATEYTTAKVTRGTLVQTVNETGTITPAKEIELNFLNSGQLAKLNVKVGDVVAPEQVLAEIDYSGLLIRQQEAMANINVSQANVAQAEASLQSAKREYEKLSGSLNETVNQAKKTLRDFEDRGTATVTTQEQAIATAESNLATTKSTYQRGIDNKFDALALTIDTKLAGTTPALDDINRILTDDNARDTLSAKNSGVLTQARAAYASGRSLAAQAASAVATFKGRKDDATLAAAYAATDAAVRKVFDALNLMSSVLDNSVPSGSFTQAQIDAYKATIAADITAASSATATLQTAKQALDDARLSYDTNVLSATQNLNQANVAYDNALRSARNSVATALTNRDQQLAGAQTRIDTAAGNVTVVRAQVGQAQANLDLLRNQISDNVLKSPIQGIITKVNYQIGEQVTPQKALVSLLTENNYQLEVDIAETDIAKISLNDPVDVKLDSLGKEVGFSGVVYFIEPAATIIQGVTYYKVKVSFNPGAEAVKPGMTADAVITTDRRENVLLMPSRAIVERDNAKFVRILENNIPREVAVTVGQNGDDGLVEVTSGVNEGDNVVTFVKDPAKK